MDYWNSKVRDGTVTYGPGAVRCQVVPMWTGLVFGSPSPVWSVIRVVRADVLTMVDCRSVRNSLESNGFMVLLWQTDKCRPVLVRTGSDSVV